MFFRSPLKKRAACCVCIFIDLGELFQMNLFSAIVSKIGADPAENGTSIEVVLHIISGNILL